MTFAIRLLALVAFAGVGLAHGDATAQQTEVRVETRMSAAVTAAVAEQVRELVDPQKTLGLYVVGAQRAAANTCEDIEVDEDKYAAVMNEILADVSGLVEAGQNNLALDRVMIGYGIALGGETAVAAYDPELYCTNALGLRDQLQADDDGLFDILEDAG